MRESALRRAQLGAALRNASSEVRSAPSRASAATLPDDVHALAAQLEEASPGLALMMQLRSRLFEHAARTAGRRGFRMVVTVGCGFVRGRLRKVVDSRVRLVEIESSDVVASEPPRKTRARAPLRLAAADLERDAWRQLLVHECDPCACRTLFLVEGLSLWGRTEALSLWLRRIGRDTAPGTEILMNLLDEDAAVHARRVAERLAGLSGVPIFGAASALPAESLPADVDAAGLEIVEIFDSVDLQRAALGVADSFTRERYIWLCARGGAQMPPAFRHIPPRTSSIRPSFDAASPRLRPTVEARDATFTTVMLTLPVTTLRRVRAMLSRAELAAAVLFDGRGSTSRIAGMLRRGGGQPPDVAALATRLWTRGLLVDDRGDCELGILRDEAFAALRRGDITLARRVAEQLTPCRGNAAARHLRAVLQARPWPRLVGDASLAVLTPAGGGTIDPAAVLATARRQVQGIANLLGVSIDVRVLIDLTGTRNAMPLTIVGEAEPYTLIRIPSPAYCDAILCHELVHVAAMAGSPWLSEGLAVWAQRSTTPGRCYPDDAAATAARSRAPLEVWLPGNATPSRTSTGRQLARADYLQAAAFVEWLVLRSGLAAFLRFFGACRPFCTTAEIDTACVALGWRSLRDLDLEWRSTGA